MKRTLQIRVSTVVQAAWFDEEANTMTVEFKSGQTRTYPGITSAEADSFEMSPSPGSWAHKHLRGRG